MLKWFFNNTSILVLFRQKINVSVTGVSEIDIKY